MSLADLGGSPNPPTPIYPIYRGFYVFISDVLSTHVTAIRFLGSHSRDGVTWSTPKSLSLFSADNGPPYYIVQKGLDENTFYGYRVKYQYSDGSQSVVSPITSAGTAQLQVSADLNIDKLGNVRGYSVGRIVGGILTNTTLSFLSLANENVNSETTTATTGAASALPVAPAGYLTFTDSGGVQRKIPYYNS